MIYHLYYRVHGASFGIFGTVNQALDARVHHRAGAHGTRLNCNKQITVSQSVVTNGCTGFAQRHNFRMGSWVMIADSTVPPAADDFSVTDDYCANWDFAYLEGALRAAQGFFHPEFVGRAPICRQIPSPSTFGDRDLSLYASRLTCFLHTSGKKQREILKTKTKTNFLG